jgi:hypothetical protein
MDIVVLFLPLERTSSFFEGKGRAARICFTKAAVGPILFVVMLIFTDAMKKSSDLLTGASEELKTMAGEVKLLFVLEPFHLQSFSSHPCERDWQVTTLPNYIVVWHFYDTPPPRNFDDEKMILQRLSLPATDPALDPSLVSNETEYAILFGPDKCGDTGQIL